MEKNTDCKSRRGSNQKVAQQSIGKPSKPIAGMSTAEILTGHSRNDSVAIKDVGKILDPATLDTIISHLRTSLEESFTQSSQTKDAPEPFFVLLDPESIQTYLEQAWDLDRFVLDNSFLYLLSLDPQLHRTDFRTLIFFKDGRLIKTRESSNNVMRSLFDLIGFSYDFIRGISTRVSGKDTHCVPYVFGRYSFLPLRGGPTRRQSSWINLSKVQHYRALKGEKGVEVHCVNQHIFQLPVRPQFFADKVLTIRPNRPSPRSPFAQRFKKFRLCRWEERRTRKQSVGECFSCTHRSHFNDFNGILHPDFSVFLCGDSFEASIVA